MARCTGRELRFERRIWRRYLPPPTERVYERNAGRDEAVEQARFSRGCARSDAECADAEECKARYKCDSGQAQCGSGGATGLGGFARGWSPGEGSYAAPSGSLPDAV